MTNYVRLLPALLTLPLVLAACGEEQQAAAPDPIRPVKTLVIPEPESGGIRTFPARIESQRRAEVSFRVPGTIIELTAKEGEAVEQGQTIAQLDPKDYQLVVDEREATLFRAQRDFERAKPLAEKGYVTLRELDRREANMKSAKASLDLAKQDLSYTTLKAPFAGGIARRLVQNFEEVKAKQPIVEMRDLNALEVKFDVPEQIILRIREAARARGEERAAPKISVSFDAAPEKAFDLAFKEIVTRADPATRTFEATYTMTTPKDLTVLPGMTANVTIDLSQYIGESNITYIPVEAVTATNELSGKVWIVNRETMTLSAREVKVGPLRGGQISVTEGLKPGERIVTAGVPFLTEGMKVSLAATPEQAEERDDDAKIRRAAEQNIKESSAKDEQAKE